MSKYYPKVKFCIDLQQEKNFFLNSGRDLSIFLPAGMSFVLRKEFLKDKDKIIKAYLENYYKDAKKYLLGSVKSAQEKWVKSKKIFFKKVDKLFKNWPWSKGSYRGYITVARRYPRFIKYKLFAFPAQSFRFKSQNLDLRVIAHEMLHFLEYDYLEKKFGLEPSESNSADSTFWQFTENLNVLIENSNFWKEFNAGIESKPYDDCKKLYVKMKKIWDKDKDIDNLVRKIFKIKKI
jgi:hypothetical protein